MMAIEVQMCLWLAITQDVIFFFFSFLSLLKTLHFFNTCWLQLHWITYIWNFILTTELITPTFSEHYCHHCYLCLFASTSFLVEHTNDLAISYSRWHVLVVVVISWWYTLHMVQGVLKSISAALITPQVFGRIG